jgi:hypothetical protein
MLAYMLIADRVQASAQNGFTDDNGAYCYFTMAELAEKTNCCYRQARRAVAELETAELITRVRPQGNRTQAYKIYLSEGTKMSSREGTKMSSHEGTKMSSHEGTKMSSKSEKIKQTRLGRSSSSAPAPSPTPSPASSEQEAEEDRTEEQGDALSKAIHKIDPTLEQEDIDEIKRRLSKQKGIYNLGAYVRTVIRNYRLEACIPPPEQEGYKPTYNIEEYESTSVLDYLDDEED